MVCGLDQYLSKTHQINSLVTEIGSIKPLWDDRQTSGGMQESRLSQVACGGTKYKVSDRFLTSLCRHFKFAQSTFNYFTPDEVFERIQKVHPRSKIRLTTDSDKALAISNPDRGMVEADDIGQILTTRESKILKVDYSDGVVTSVHRSQEAAWVLGGDMIEPTFTLSTPVDGFGPPTIHLSILRQICQNGAIGLAPAFRSEVQMGKKDSSPTFALTRILDSFNNEEGFDSIRQRLESARQTTASMHEVHSLEISLNKAFHSSSHAELHMVKKAIRRLAGDPANLYGIVSDAVITEKKQRLLPMLCSLYDLINLASEVATHYPSKLKEAEQIHAWVGSLISWEYDLEGTGDRGHRSQSFYLN